jgi:hypothetical protein
MRRLEFRILGFTESDLDDSDESQQDRQDHSRRQSSRGKTAKGWHGGLRGTLLIAVLVAAGLASTNHSPALSLANSQSSPAQCVGEWRAKLDLTGKLYLLPNETAVLPDYSKLRNMGSVYRVKEIHIDTRSSFPAAVNGSYAFGIDYQGKFWIDSSGKYLFTLTSDDGSMLYVDGQLLLDENGTHGAYTKAVTVYLRRGQHTLRAPYFESAGGEASLWLDVCRGEAHR